MICNRCFCEFVRNTKKENNITTLGEGERERGREGERERGREGERERGREGERERGKRHIQLICVIVRVALMV